MVPDMAFVTSMVLNVGLCDLTRSFQSGPFEIHSES